MLARWRLSVVATVFGAVADVRIEAGAGLDIRRSDHCTQLGVARHVVSSPSSITAY